MRTRSENKERNENTSLVKYDPSRVDTSILEDSLEDVDDVTLINDIKKLNPSYKLPPSLRQRLLKWRNEPNKKENSKINMKQSKSQNDLYELIQTVNTNLEQLRREKSADLFYGQIAAYLRWELKIPSLDLFLMIFGVGIVGFILFHLVDLVLFRYFG